MSGLVLFFLISTFIFKFYLILISFLSWLTLPFSHFFCISELAVFIKFYRESVLIFFSRFIYNATIHRSIDQSALLGLCAGDNSRQFDPCTRDLFRSPHRTVQQTKNISMSMQTPVFRYWRQCSIYHRLIESNALPLL